MDRIVSSLLLLVTAVLLVVSTSSLLRPIASENQTFSSIYMQAWEETVGKETTYTLTILVE